MKTRNEKICLIETIHDNNNNCFIVKSFDNFLFFKNRTNLEHSMKFPQFFIGKFQKRMVFVLYNTKITKFVLLKNVIQKLSHYHNF